MSASRSNRGPRPVRAVGEVEEQRTTASCEDSVPFDSVPFDSVPSDSVPSDSDHEALLHVPQFQIDPPSERRQRDSRPLRQGALRELLDAEFQRCHRFDTFNSIVGDLRTLIRRAVVREEESEEEIELSRPRSAGERSLDLGNS